MQFILKVFRNFADVTLLSAFLALYGLSWFQQNIIFLRPKKKLCVFPVTRPNLIFPATPKFLLVFKKMKSYHTQPTLFAAIFIGFATFAVIFEPRSEKTGLRGFRPGPTETGLRNH